RADVARLEDELALTRVELAAYTPGRTDADIAAEGNRLARWSPVLAAFETAGVGPGDFDPGPAATTGAARDPGHLAEELSRSLAELRRLEDGGVVLATPEDWDHLREAVALAGAAGPD